MSDTTQIDGPGQSFAAMTTNETVASRLRPFLNQGAASATFGNLLTLPLGGGLLYVTPVYTQRQGSPGSYPVLRFVVSVRAGVGIGDTRSKRWISSGTQGQDRRGWWRDRRLGPAAAPRTPTAKQGLTRLNRHSLKLTGAGGRGPAGYQANIKKAQEAVAGATALGK